MNSNLRDAGLSALVALGLFGPMIGLRTEAGATGLFLIPRPLALAVAVAAVADRATDAAVDPWPTPVVAVLSGGNTDPMLLVDLVRHAEHFAALVGWEHLGLGSDLDGGFGAEKTPAGIDRYRDLTRFLDLLPAEARAGVQGENWQRWLLEYLFTS